MFALITGLSSLFFISLTGWTITTYVMKKNSRKLIQEELKNLFDIFKMLFVSIKNLTQILAKNSFLSDENETKSSTQNKSNECKLSLVETVEEIESSPLKVQIEEDDDTALSSFSPEVVAVITEEEEKVA